MCCHSWLSPLHFGCFGFLIGALPEVDCYNKRFVQIVMHTRLLRVNSDQQNKIEINHLLISQDFWEMSVCMIPKLKEELL